MSPSVNAAYVREQYELLRREATTIDPIGARGHGLALLMTRGLTAWLETVQTVPSRASASAESPTLTPHADRMPWRADDRAALTRVLASLVFTCAQEARA